MKNLYSFLKILLSCAVFWCNILTGSTLKAQNSFNLPVKAVLQVMPPASVYLEDYQNGLGNISIQLTFKDDGQQYRNFFLKLTLENASLHLQTNLNASLPPITLTSEVPYTLTAEELGVYFLPQNLIANDHKSQQALNEGRLPDGSYTLSFEVVEFDRIKTSSIKYSALLWVMLNEPPRLVFPESQKVINPQDDAQILFQWQEMPAKLPLSGVNLDYRLRIYEILDESAGEPQNAIHDQNVRLLHETAPVTGNQWWLSVPEVNLQKGKLYIWQVEALTDDGREYYKNGGFSQVNWFRYGYPEEAKINLVTPEDHFVFGLNQKRLFQWSAPDKKVESQPFIYTVKITEWDTAYSGQSFEDIDPWYEYQVPLRKSQNGDFFELRERHFEKMKNYAWQVSCISGQQLVARSEIGFFHGPPLLNSFKAGTHIVKIVNLEVARIDSLTGTGLVKIGMDKEIEVSFEGLKVYDPSRMDDWILEEGQIKAALSDLELVALEGIETKNGQAYFHADSLRLDRQGLFLGGKVYWDLPHPALNEEKPQVVSHFHWFSYNAYKITGKVYLDATLNRFSLLDPYGFELYLNEDSYLEVFLNQYWFYFDGSCFMPEQLNTRLNQRLEVPFISQQLEYMPVKGLNLNDELHLAERSGIYLNLSKGFIDLSEEKSFDKLSSNPTWKGFYVQKAELGLLAEIDQQDRFRLPALKTLPVIPSENNRQQCWIEASGLHFEFDTLFQAPLEANLYTFPVDWKYFSIQIDRNYLQKGENRYDMLLPVFGENARYPAEMPLSDAGFLHATLSGVDSSFYVYNEGNGDQEVHLKVENAKLQDDHLDMQVALIWPSLNYELKGLRNLRLWGNYQLGFLRPNGLQALDRQEPSQMKGYPVIIDAIAAGSDEKVYSFALSAKIQLGNDMSGGEGLPSVNMYAMISNQWAPDSESQFVESDVQDFDALLASQQQEQEELKASMNVRLMELADQVRVLQENTARDSSDYQFSDIFLSDEEGELVAPEPGKEKIGGIRSLLNEGQREFVDEMVQAVVAELLKPLTDPIQAQADSVNRKIRETIMSQVDSSANWLQHEIKKLVMSLAEPIAQDARIGDHDYSGHVLRLGESLADSLSLTIKYAFTNAVDNSIVTPVEKTLKEDLSGQLIAHLERTAQKTAFELLNGETSPQSFEATGQETLQVLRAMADSLYTKIINPASLRGMVRNAAQETYKNASPEMIAVKLRNVLTQAIDDLGAEIASDMAEDFANQALGQAVGVEVEINFADLGNALLSGDLSKIKLDSISVKHESKFLDFNGKIGFLEDDKVYGNIWKGHILLIVKEPEEFAFKGYYMTGRKPIGEPVEQSPYSEVPQQQDEVDYWFAQLSSVKEHKDMKGPIPKKASELQNPINLGLISLRGVSGRLYKRMREDSSGLMLPDITRDYGAYLHMVLFDVAKEGKNLRLELEGQIDKAVNGNISLTLNGNMQMKSGSPKMAQIDSLAMAKGEIEIKYNSAKEHFFGKAGIEVRHTAICAAGMLLVDVRPDKWRVALGNREETISIVPACMGWGGFGWLDVNEYSAEVGLGLSLSVYAEKGFDFGSIGVTIGLDAGLSALVYAAMRYDPHISLMEAGITAEVWAKIFAKWKVLGVSGSVTLIDIYCRGDLMMRFEPSPTLLKGSFSGYVRVVGIGKSFAVDYETNLT